MQVLVDSGSSISIINKTWANIDKVYSGKTVCVQSYDGKRQLHHHWINVVLVFQGRCAETSALVMDGVKYDFLLSRPDMRQLRINIYWNDEVSVERQPDTNSSLLPQTQGRKLVKSRTT